MAFDYTNFLIASTGASAAFIGLLFVGMSIVNSDDSNHATRERRSVLASSAFLALVDAFFVSIVGFLGGTRTLAVGELLLAIVGFLATVALVTRAYRAGNFAEHFRYRGLNLVFAGSSLGLYSAQFIVAVVLLLDHHSAVVVKLSLIIVVGLYASALARAWEITGIRNRFLSEQEAVQHARDLSPEE